MIQADVLQVFNVRFSNRFANINRRTDRFNSKRLIGSGTITINRTSLRIDGRCHRAFRSGKPASFEVPLSQVMNVHSGGRTVRFDVHPPAGALWTVTFAADDEATAAGLVALLPSNRTEAFAKATAEFEEFRTRFMKLEPAMGVTQALVGINVVVFGLLGLAGAGFFRPVPQVMVRWGSNFGALTASGQWWRLLSAMFMHFGLLHLAFNCWALYTSGRLVERLFGSTRFLILYLFAGLTGGLASLLWHPLVNSAGASGAIFGIFGALLGFLLRPGHRMPPSIMRAQLSSAMAFVGYNLFFGATYSGIDNAAHVGGLVGGFAMGYLLAQPIEAEERRQASAARVPAAIAIGIAVIAAGAALVAHANPERERLRAVYLGLYWADEHEAAAVSSLNSFLNETSTHRTSDQAIPDQIEKSILPKWQAMRTHVAENPAGADSGLYALQQAYLQYLDHRIEALKDYAAGTREHDNAKIRAGTALLERGKADIDAIQKTRASLH